MTHHQEPQREAQAEHDKTILPFRVVRIEELDGMLIIKYRLRLFERDTMFPFIQCGLGSVPLEADISHMYNVNIPFLRDVFKTFQTGGKLGSRSKCARPGDHARRAGASPDQLGGTY